ncbi:MAG TPA: diphthamide synthesis protein [Candidatus Nanoarchaeia archaeon]|nr:diphthamide synthesis protein [Candidatus Nanoarchaeia archaeon]
MKTVFMESRYTGPVNLRKLVQENLPDKIGLITTVQFLDCIPAIKKKLAGKEVLMAKGRQAYPSQLLGCDADPANLIADKVDCFLYVGTGKFHPIKAAIDNIKPVFALDPVTGIFNRITQKETDAYLKKKKGAMLRFLSATNIGVLVSTKVGQHYHINLLDKLKEKYPQKHFYIFICDTVDYTQLNNFPFVEAWVNTACPRIDEDITIVNISEL